MEQDSGEFVGVLKKTAVMSRDKPSQEAARSIFLEI